MNELMLELQPYIISILAVLLTYLGARLKACYEDFLEERIDEKQRALIKDIVKGAVQFVEQVAKVDLEMAGKENYELAKAKALELLNSKNLVITDTELDMLIESFVLELTLKEIDASE